MVKNMTGTCPARNGEKSRLKTKKKKKPRTEKRLKRSTPMSWSNGFKQGENVGEERRTVKKEKDQTGKPLVFGCQKRELGG